MYSPCHDLKFLFLFLFDQDFSLYNSLCTIFYDIHLSLRPTPSYLRISNLLDKMDLSPRLLF